MGLHAWKCKIRNRLFLTCWLLSTFHLAYANQDDIGLTKDKAQQEITHEFKQGSHVKLYIPNLPYLAISHAINGALLRPANNAQGWQYDLAVSHQSINDKIWLFQLRQDAYFQYGTHFNADSVINNIKAFQEQPFTFSNFAKVLDRVEKIDDYTVKFYMKAPYGAFPYDAIWLQFYTQAYLNKFGWNGKPTCPNLVEPGPYGIGPYILTKGYVEGDRRSASVELTANSNYWGDDKPKVERMTINLDIEPTGAFEAVTKNEGIVDVMPIAFSDQVETVRSPYAKLSSSPSKNNYAMHFNLISGNPAIKDAKIRKAINQAIDQDYLLNLSMLGEGVSSPTMVSPNFFGVNEAIESLSDYLAGESDKPVSLAEMKKQVSEYQQQHGLDPTTPLKLKVLAQKSFLFLIKDIQFFLSQINIELEAQILPTEEEVFKQLHVTWKNQNTTTWDLLLWGNTDWYKHPWSAFFVYLPSYAWSTLPPDPYLVSLIDKMFETNIHSSDYIEVTADIIKHVHENNLMVFLPTPNNVFAINKEVYFSPGSSAFYYLREIQVTDYHWSVRGNTLLPEARKRPVEILRTGVIQ